MSEWKQIEPNPAPIPKAEYRLEGANGRLTVQAETCNGAPSWWLHVDLSKGKFIPRAIGDAGPFEEALDFAILQTTDFLAWLKSQQSS